MLEDEEVFRVLFDNLIHHVHHLNVLLLVDDGPLSAMVLPEQLVDEDLETAKHANHRVGLVCID